MAGAKKLCNYANRYKWKNSAGEILDAVNYYTYPEFNDSESSYNVRASQSSAYSAVNFNVGFDSWNKTSGTGYYFNDNECRVIEPGTRPCFANVGNIKTSLDTADTSDIRTPILRDLSSAQPEAFPSNVAYLTFSAPVKKGAYIRIYRKSTTLYFETTDVQWCGTLSPLPRYGYSASFADGVLPQRIIVELQAAGGGGSGGANDAWSGIEGTGGGSGAYWCGVVDLSRLDDYSDPDYPHILIYLGPAGAGGGNSSAGGNAQDSYLEYVYTYEDDWDTHDVSDRYVTVPGGKGGQYAASSGGAGGAAPTVESGREGSYVWTLISSAGAAGAHEESSGDNFWPVGAKASAYVKSYQPYMQYYHISRGGNAGGSGTSQYLGSGGGGGGSALYTGGSDRADDGTDNYDKNRVANRQGKFGSGGAGGDDGWNHTDNRRRGGNGGCAVAIIHIGFRS